jgi:hypothetical protein
MAQITESKLDRELIRPDRGVLRYTGKVPADFVAPEGTLVLFDGTDITSAEHVDGDDDSALFPLVTPRYADDVVPMYGFQRSAYGRDEHLTVFSGYMVELDVLEADTSGYAFGEPAYAVDNATVANAAGDGSGGSYPLVGPVYEIDAEKETVTVLVQGIER